MAERKRDDDSLNAATVAINDAQTRIANIEAALTKPDQLGELVASAVEHSSPLKKQLKVVMFELLDDYDSRKQLESVIQKIDRGWWNTTGKKMLTIVGSISLLLIGALIEKFIL